MFSNNRRYQLRLDNRGRLIIVGPRNKRTRVNNRGAQGPQGPQGIQGPQGAVGPKGDSGAILHSDSYVYMYNLDNGVQRGHLYLNNPDISQSNKLFVHSVNLESENISGFLLARSNGIIEILSTSDSKCYARFKYSQLENTKEIVVFHLTPIDYSANHQFKDNDKVIIRLS